MPRRAAMGWRIARGFLLAGAAAGVAGAAAQTRTFYTANVQAEVEHDSNPNLAIGGSPGTTWLRILPSLNAGYVYGNEEFDAEAALTAEKSSNTDVAKDRVDPRVRGVWKHADALNTLQLTALADRRALRALDVRENVPIEHIPVGVDGARTLYSLDGNWARELDARSRIGMDLRQDWERYTDVATPDFRLTVGSARYTRQQDDRRGWYAAVNGQHYSSDSNVSSTVAGALLGFTQSFSDSLRLDANVGPMHFNHPSKHGWQGAVSAEYTAQRWTAGLDLLRTPAANSSVGGLVVSDEARARLRYEIDAVTRVEIGAAYSRQSGPDSQHTLASVAWVHEWSPAWQVAVRASVNEQHLAEGTARSNRIALVLKYTAADL